MAQFEAFRLPNGEIVLDLQADVVAIPSRVVAPLRPPREGTRAYSMLEPVMEVGGTPMVLHVTELQAVRARLVGGTPLADLSYQREAIIRALDLLFTGA